jgi:hypothetical protein
MVQILVLKRSEGREGNAVMISRHIAKITFAAALAAAVSLTASAQNPGPGEVPSNAASAARPGGGLVILDFKPAMDDLMTMLVQPRHIKLYYAGQEKNWKLAAFQSNELRAALARIGRTIPTYRNIGVDTAVASIFSEKLKAVDAAIKAADSTQFDASYRELTAACNECHVGMEHPFLVMKVPQSLNYPDQEFHP